MSSQTRPWWRYRQRERFARAVDSSPEAGAPQDTRLAGELAVVDLLQRGTAATAPDDAARARMRSRLFAELALPNSAQLGEQPAPLRPSPVPRTRPAPPADPEPGITHRTVIPAPRTGRVTGTRARVLIALGAAFCLVLALSGMTLLLSRDALPGDPLYAVRRTVESAALGLTSGDDSKGRKHLEYASDRIGDIETLAARYPDPTDSPVGDYLTAFADFDSDATEGTADLTAYATDHAMDGLTTLRDWAAQQSGRIEAVEPGLPVAAKTTAARSMTLLGGIGTRAEELLARDNCYTITTGHVDSLGEVPVLGPCDSAPDADAPRSTDSGGTVTGTTLPTQTPAPDVSLTSGASADQRASGPVVTTTFPVPPEVFQPPVQGAQPPTTTTGQPPNTITVPLPLPGLTIPPLLPGLPGITLGQ